MSVKRHYDQHLSHFYSWMLGDLAPKIKKFEDLLIKNNLIPTSTKTAIDLGAGNGIQSFALKNLGFEVTAIDFNRQLLDELRANERSDGISIVQADILTIANFKDLKPELIICCGDTLTHLESKQQIEKLIRNVAQTLAKNGHLVLTYRDYSRPLNDKQRFIPVKSSEERILTCILEYQREKVKVIDLLHEKKDGGWHQQVSSYQKVRISPDEISAYVIAAGMTITFDKPLNGMQTLIAQKLT